MKNLLTQPKNRYRLIDKEQDMTKCEWKDGRFVPCDGFEPDFYSEGSGGSNFCFCRACDTDITKPEPEQPIIKRSGDTWVARYDGVDVLVTDPLEAKSPHCLLTLFNNCKPEYLRRCDL